MSKCLKCATLVKCNQGAIPTPLMVLPNSRCFKGPMPIPNMFDAKPFVNVLPFGFCKIMMAPCPLPIIPLWTDCSKVILNGAPEVHSGSCINCPLGGKIKPISGDPDVKP